MLEIINISNLYEIVHNIDYKVMYETTKEIDYTAIIATFAGLHIALLAFAYPHIYNSNAETKHKTPGLYNKMNEIYIFKKYLIVQSFLLIFSLIALFCNKLESAIFSFVLASVAIFICICIFKIINMYKFEYEKIKPEYQFPKEKINKYFVNEKLSISLNDKSTNDTVEIKSNHKEIQIWQQVIIDKINSYGEINDIIELIDSKISFYIRSYLEDIKKEDVKIEINHISQYTLYDFTRYPLDRVQYLIQASIDKGNKELAYTIQDDFIGRFINNNDDIFNNKNKYYIKCIKDMYSASTRYKIKNNSFDVDIDARLLVGIINSFIKIDDEFKIDCFFDDKLEYIKYIFQDLVKYNIDLFSYNSNFINTLKQGLLNGQQDFIIKQSKTGNLEKEKSIWYAKINMDIHYILAMNNRYKELFYFIHSENKNSQVVLDTKIEPWNGNLLDSMLKLEFSINSMSLIKRKSIMFHLIYIQVLKNIFNVKDRTLNVYDDSEYVKLMRFNSTSTQNILNEIFKSKEIQDLYLNHLNINLMDYENNFIEYFVNNKTIISNK